MTKTINTNFGPVHASTSNKQGVTITWEMMQNAMATAVKPHHVEQVSYYLFSAAEGYDHQFKWGNIETMKGVGKKTMAKIYDAYRGLCELTPDTTMTEIIDNQITNDHNQEVNMTNNTNNIIPMLQHLRFANKVSEEYTNNTICRRDKKGVVTVFVKTDFYRQNARNCRALLADIAKAAVAKGYEPKFQKLDANRYGLRIYKA